MNTYMDDSDDNNEAAVKRQMFGSASDDDDDEEEKIDVDREEEEKYAAYNGGGYSDVIETSGIQFKGLMNQGATCYLNALLQSLYFTPELREGIYQLTADELGMKHIEEADRLDEEIKNNAHTLKDEDIATLSSLGYTMTRAKRALVKAKNDYETAKNLLQTNEVPSVKRILIQLRQFFSLLSDGQESSVSTKDLTDAFGWVSREVRVQHDAHELNRILIDAIERSLKGTSKEELINNIYQGQTVSRILCLKCEHCSERTENFLDAIVQVQHLKNLKDSLTTQCKSEYLVGDNKYFCDKCNEKQDAKKSIAYTKLPNVLTLALNRFIFNLHTLNREKCNDQFEFPLVFDFAPFLDEQLANTQKHRTKQDEQELERAHKEYEREQKVKEDAKQKRLQKEKEKAEAKHNHNQNKKNQQSKGKEKEKGKESESKNDRDKNNNNKDGEKQPLAITLPEHVTQPQIVSGTHQEVAPMAQPQSHHQNNGNEYGGVWREGIPRSRSQEDEDLQRAIAASLGQEYIAPPKPVYRAPVTVPAKSSALNHPLAASKIEQEAFVKQPEITYSEALDILLNGNCCFGVYDHKMKIWRSAIYMNHWPKNESIMVRFGQDNQLNPSSNFDKFKTIKDFPVDYIMNDASRFKTTERELRDMANLAEDKIETWLKRKSKPSKKNKRETQKVEMNTEETKKEPQEEAPKKTESQPTTEKEKEKVKEKVKEKEKETDKVVEKEKEKEKDTDTVKEKTKGTETNDTEKKKEAEETKKEESKTEALDDWSKRKDFHGVQAIGYLCDDGEVIQGDCLRQNKENGKIFVHFNIDAAHFGEKYAWLDTPNERICPPPTNRPRQKAIGLGAAYNSTMMNGMYELKEMNSRSSTAYSSSVRQSYNVYDHGTTHEQSYIAGSGSNGYNRVSNRTVTNNASGRSYGAGWKLAKCDIDLNSNHLYALTAVVIHRGTPHAGHYHAYIKDFMMEGKYQKQKPEQEQEKEQEKEKETEQEHADETQAFLDKVCWQSMWYDFNDSSVYRIPTNQVAKQYGGRDECAYMLVYRKINKKTATELMKQTDVTLPKDLVEYLKEANAKIEQQRKVQEAERNRLKIQIVHPKCFEVKDKKLTMNPFIESLLKKIIAISKEKLQTDRVLNANKSNQNESGPANENENENEKKNENGSETESKLQESTQATDLEEDDIEKLYASQSWPTNLSAPDIDKIVQEHYKQQSIFIECDQRDGIDKLIGLMHEKLSEEKLADTQINADNLSVHFLSIPDVFQDHNISCPSIATLLDSNLGANVDDRIYPIKSKRLRAQKSKQAEEEEEEDKEDEKEDDKSDDEYPYQRMPVKIGDLPFRKLDFIMNTRTCFVWNGRDVNGSAFNLKFARNTQITIKYFANDVEVDDVITVSIDASLFEIWQRMKAQFAERQPSILQIEKPIFTLLSSASADWPDIIEITDRNQELYVRPKFAKLLHHKLNPIKRWYADKYRGDANKRFRSNSDPNRLAGGSANIGHNDLYSANYGRGATPYQVQPFAGDVTLCVEDVANLPKPLRDTRASQQWNESTKLSTMIIYDYTQIEELKEEKEEKEKEKEPEQQHVHNWEELGSSHNPKVKMRKLTWKIPRGTSLEKFFEIARQRCNIANDVEIRVLRCINGERYLQVFPWKFQLKQHELVLERGRYPKYNEVYLMACIINSDNSTSQYLPLIVDKKKSVKFVKQAILKLFKLNVNDYKKYVCYNITASVHHKDKCWRDQLTLESLQVDAKNGERVGIQIGVDTINKKVLIMKDTRNLSKPWDFTQSFTDVSMTASGNGLNPYIQQEIGTLSIEGNSDLQQLRQQIYSMQQIQNDVDSFQHLMLCWLDNIYQIPLSFPKLADGKLAGQKNWDSARSVICVEVLDKAMPRIPKHSRFLHVHLAKIESLSQGTGTDTNTDTNTNTNTETKTEAEPAAAADAETKTEAESETKTETETETESQAERQQYKDVSISYWPPDHHVRVLYHEAGNEKHDKVTYQEMAKFVASKYDIVLQNVLIAMFRVQRNEWILLDDSCDANKQGMVGKPFNIKETNRHGQIFSIIDLSQCRVQDGASNEEKLEFIKQSMQFWSPPPLAPKAKFYFDHAHRDNGGGVNAISRTFTRSYDNRQLKITNID